MEIAVRSGAVVDFPSDWSVEERNRSFGPMPKDCGRCTVDESSKAILVVVPPKIPGVTCQTDTSAFISLVSSFRNPVLKAVEMGGKSITIIPLGTRFQRWKHVQSAAAARKAVEDIMPVIPDDFRITFVVGEGKDGDRTDFVVWDDVMTF